MNIMIKGTGRYTPSDIVANSRFQTNSFYDPDGEVLTAGTETIISRFREISGITERRYVKDSQTLSDIATKAAEAAIEDAGADPESTDVIIMAHNFGNVNPGSAQVDLLPSISSRIKHSLSIANPDCVAFDIVCGCAGWVQALILARQYILSGDAKRVLVVGGETLSRVTDPSDRDSMIFADGAGAVMLAAEPGAGNRGIIATCSQTYSHSEAYYLHLGESNKRDNTGLRYLKMNGRKIYEFALKKVPFAMKRCLEKSGVHISELKKIFLHQANEKMDEAILKRFYELYEIGHPPPHVMPMNISKLGNTSVASLPTLLDSVLKHEYAEHSLDTGDKILIASVGAGMNISAVVYVF
jgi:3-oxoacyl-[acyl-carrier-protein] synthase-3